jgi:hypothetical protein
VGWVGGESGQRVVYEDAPVLFHSGMDHLQSAESSQHLRTGIFTAFSDWYVFTQADDGVLTDASSFAYSAFAATGRIPVTIWNDDAPNASQPTPPDAPATWRSTHRGRCERRVWGAYDRPFQWIMSAEAYFPRSAQVEHHREAHPLPPLPWGHGWGLGLGPSTSVLRQETSPSA